MVWFTPLAFVAYILHPFAGFATTFCFSMVGVIATFVMNNHYDAFKDNPDERHAKYYVSPLTRCSVYFVGFLLGLFCNYIEARAKSRGEKRIRISACMTTCLQIIAGALFLFITLIEMDNYPKGYIEPQWGVGNVSAFDALGRPGWGLGLSLLTLSLKYGRQRGIIAGFLS